MAINYTNLFTMLGKLVKGVNNVKTYYGELDTDLGAVQTAYSTYSQFSLLQRIPDTWRGFKDNVYNWIGQINGQAFSLLSDRELILKELPIGSGASYQDVLPLLIADMVANSQHVTKSVVTIGAVTTTSVNASVGEAHINGVLDGYTPPGAGMSASKSYNGLTTQMAEDDSVSLICTQDSETGGVSEGFETFQWTGLPTNPGLYHYLSFGTGTNVSLQPLNSLNLISNGEFESFSTNTPSSWTIVSGTVGTHILKETSVVQRGSSALKYTGDGSQATISISQAPVISQLFPLKRYMIAAWVRGTSATASGTLTIQFEGTGYTAGGTEKIEMDSTALSAATSWTLKKFYINMPLEIPDDFKLVVKVTGTLTNAKSVYIDGLVLGPVAYVNGVNVAIVAGHDKFLKGDKFTFTISNNDAGVFQTWFRKATGYQIPTDNSPAISDSLAT
jgi:hypothetical protein